MSQPSTSRILRTPPGTRGGLSGAASLKTKPIDPLETAISALVFVAALFTLGYFAISNWSNGTSKARIAPPPVELTETERTARELDQKVQLAISDSALDSFYSGDLQNGAGPAVTLSGPVMAEDGSGPLEIYNTFGAPTMQLFAAENGGGWGIPFAPVVQNPEETGLQ